MRDVNRIRRVTRLLEELWLKHPDMRLGQLVFNLARHEVTYMDMGSRVWNVDDTQMEQYIVEVLSGEDL